MSGVESHPRLLFLCTPADARKFSLAPLGLPLLACLLILFGARDEASAQDATFLYQLHDDGESWQFNGTACNGVNCRGWKMLDNNPRTRFIALTEVIF